MVPTGDAIALRSQAACANCTNGTGCIHLTVYPREPSDLLFTQLKGFHCVYSLCTACVPWDPSTPGFNIRLAHPHSCILWFILLCTEKTKVFLLFFQILRTRFQWMKTWPQILIHPSATGLMKLRALHTKSVSITRLPRDTEKNPRAPPWPHAIFSFPCAGTQFLASLKVYSLGTEKVRCGGWEVGG